MTGAPVKQASINLANASSESWNGFTDDYGESIFTATVVPASQTTSISVNHSGYMNVESPIDGIGKFIEIGKKIAMTSQAIENPPVDADGDGVLAGEDADDNDASVAKILTSVYTLAFEDQYNYYSNEFNKLNKPGNDADFNDLVVRLTITEKIDSSNKITKIELKTKLLAASAGCSDSFGIYVNKKNTFLSLIRKLIRY